MITHMIHFRWYADALLFTCRQFIAYGSAQAVAFRTSPPPFSTHSVVLTLNSNCLNLLLTWIQILLSPATIRRLVLDRQHRIGVTHVRDHKSGTTRGPPHKRRVRTVNKVNSLKTLTVNCCSLRSVDKTLKVEELIIEHEPDVIWRRKPPQRRILHDRIFF